MQKYAPNAATTHHADSFQPRDPIAMNAPSTCRKIDVADRPPRKQSAGVEFPDSLRRATQLTYRVDSQGEWK
jgi:hypothetical protein